MVDTFKVDKKYFLKVSELTPNAYELFYTHPAKKFWLDGLPRKCEDVLDNNKKVASFPGIPGGYWIYIQEMRKYMYEYSSYTQEEMEL